MIKKIKKTTLLVLISFSSFVFLGGPSHGGSVYGGDEGTHSTGADSRTPTYGSSCDSVRCGYSYSWQHNSDVIIEMKDINGNRIRGNIFDSNISKEFLAGTYVMLKVYEKEDFTSSASYSVSAKRQEWNCTPYEKIVDTYCSGEDEDGDGYEDCREIIRYEPGSSYTKTCLCNPPPEGGYVEKEFSGWIDVTSEYVDSCASNVELKSYDLEAMYEAKYRDSNDIDNTSTTTVRGHECSRPRKTEVEGNGYGGDGYSNDSTLSGDCTVSYDIETDICINVKNGNVRYIDDQNASQCKENEYKLTKTDDGYWKYFIPLNANSTNDFSFKLNSSGATEVPEMCQAYKDYYPDSWQSIIKMNPNGTCYFETEVIIPVIQRFYNELENGINFKGFNFYYKPIDINNPFPNGLTDTSIWYDWNQNRDENPNLSESYNKLTYFADTGGNEENIRNYTKDNPYTSWENMNVDGTSDFIKKEGIVTSNVRLDSFYALGCGPWNENEYNEDGSKNYFYQPECGTK